MSRAPAPTPSARITFLANMEMGGTVPSGFTKHALLRLMVLPRTQGLKVEQWDPTTASTRQNTGSRKEEKVEESVTVSHSAKEATPETKNTQLLAENAALRRVIVDKDEELKRTIADKDNELAMYKKEIVGLRRRLSKYVQNQEK